MPPVAENTRFICPDDGEAAGVVLFFFRWVDGQGWGGGVVRRPYAMAVVTKRLYFTKLLRDEACRGSADKVWQGGANWGR